MHKWEIFNIQELIGLLKELSSRIEGKKYHAYSLSILGNDDVSSQSESATERKVTFVSVNK